MRKENNTPHLGMIVTLGAIIVAIWMLAIYGTIQEEHEIKYDVTVRPGAVSYGTHSSATMPMVSSPTRHTAAPMISGSAVRSYAHYGHAAYTVHHTPYTVHTTSSATVHTIGSGNGGGGGITASSSGGKGGSRGIAYGGGSVSMPTLALATTSFASSSAAETAGNARRGLGPRRAPVNEDDGASGERRADDTEPGKWWYWDEDEGWVTESEGMNAGVKWNDNGVWYTWNGSTWIPDSGMDVQDPTNTPISDAPWLWMLLLALGYGIAKMRLSKQNKVQ